MYEIRILKHRCELEDANAADIGIYNWGGDYRPRASGILCYLPGQGFLVRLCCEEENPRAVYTEPDSMVCRDSCLEFFGDFRPDKPEIGYLNLECNANGALLCFCGPDRQHRRSLAELGLAHPKVEVFRAPGVWGWEALIPCGFLEKIYGKQEFKAGDVLRGNFYKCGDRTEHPHYGSYTAITAPQPDFHRPECFADMILFYGE